MSVLRHLSTDATVTQPLLSMVNRQIPPNFVKGKWLELTETR